MQHLNDSSVTRGIEIDCSTDPIKSLQAMFVDVVQAQSIAAGQCPALRPVFLKSHGIAAAELRLRNDLPEKLRIGIFSQPGKAIQPGSASRPTRRRHELITSPHLALASNCSTLQAKRFSGTLTPALLISYYRILIPSSLILQLKCVLLQRLAWLMVITVPISRPT